MELGIGDLVHDESPSMVGYPSGGPVQAGIISDIDAQGCFGLIESDEGEIVLFGRDSFRPNYKQLRIGQRVEFTIDRMEPAPHASSVIPERHH